MFMVRTNDTTNNVEKDTPLPVKGKYNSNYFKLYIKKKCDLSLITLSRQELHIKYNIFQ